jgi:actin related protein 2/3 complex subunit 1A/1B
VWTYEENTEKQMIWKPTLVILRVNRAATSVRWNATETKFAVGSGTKQVPVCFFEEEHNWWVSKAIKKHKSTVLSVDWHPTYPIIVTTSSDFKCRIILAYVSGVDSPESAKSHPWSTGQKLSFGDVLQEFPCSGWVHSAQFSPSGKYMAFCGHDSTISFVTISGPNSPVQTIKRPGLPYRSLLFLSDSSLVAAGFEINPNGFVESNGTWAFKGKFDKEDEKKDQTTARSVFQKQVSDDLKTRHQNSISEIRMMETGSDGKVTKFSTSGLDGFMVCWNLKTLEQALAGLAI